MKVKLDKSILWFILGFFIISIISIYCAALYTSKDLGNLALKQAVWYGVGIVIVIGVVRLGNEFIYQNAWLLYGIGILSLLFLLLFASPINNSKCWFVIPGIGSIQPSEFVKLFIMLVLCNLISEFRKNHTSPTLYDEFVFIIKSLLIIAIPAILTFLQPDTGAVIIYLVIYIAMMFLSGIRMRWFLFALGILFLLIGTVGGIYFIDEELFVSIFGTSFYYRIERLFMWKDGIGLQLENAISSIGSSGLLGHGFNKTPIYFPESSTDFIFAVFASNFGFCGVLILISLLVSFDLYIISLLKKNADSRNVYIIGGILGMLLFQQIQNIGMTVGIFPITGITLPFISYGGSSLISYMIIVGVLINIASEKKSRFKYK